MSILKTVIFGLWVVFWLYWWISAIGVKRGSQTNRTASYGRVLLIIIAVAILRIFKGNDNLTVTSPTLQVIGTVLFLAGLSLAVWARLYLGRNWGMPMTKKDEPELVTSGPYRSVRHPIYSGILLAMFGTALATNVYWFLAFVVMGIYFIYSATVEEKILATTFPDSYPDYRSSTKMLIPFVL